MRDTKLAIVLVLVGLIGSINTTSHCADQSARQRVISKAQKEKIREGAVLFRANGCYDCHSINGRGSTEGVSLSSVGLRRNKEFLIEQLQDPEEHVRKNAKAFNQAPNLMPSHELSKKEIGSIVAYLQTLKKSVPKQGEKSKWYNQL